MPYSVCLPLGRTAGLAKSLIKHALLTDPAWAYYVGKVIVSYREDTACLRQGLEQAALRGPVRLRPRQRPHPWGSTQVAATAHASAARLQGAKPKIRVPRRPGPSQVGTGSALTSVAPSRARTSCARKGSSPRPAVQKNRPGPAAILPRPAAHRARPFSAGAPPPGRLSRREPSMAWQGAGPCCRKVI